MAEKAANGGGGGRKITTCLAGRQVRRQSGVSPASPYFPVLVLLLGVIDVIEQSEDKGKIYSGGKIFFFSKMEASVKAAKFHSCVVGQPIDCKLTVIEQECTLLLRRVMALRSVAPSSCR